MTSSKTYLAGIILIIIVGAYFLFGFNSGKDKSIDEIGNPINEGGIQKITLGVKDYNYYPNIIKVKANSPVRIYLDSTVQGCLRDFTIRSFNVRKYLRTPQEYVEFTPDKKGTFGFACSMGMGTGTIIVE